MRHNLWKQKLSTEFWQQKEKCQKIPLVVQGPGVPEGMLLDET